MSRSPLQGVVLKLNRAQKHLQTLHEQMNTFIKGHVYDAVAEMDRQGRSIVRLKNIQQPPPEISVLVGEFLYDTRSALDHLAYDLTALNLGDPPPRPFDTRCAFPIFSSGRKYRKRQKNGKPANDSGLFKVWGMRRDARAQIERLQPYHRRNNPASRALWMLEELSNVDKHRLLHLTATTLLGTSYKLTVMDGSMRIHRVETFPGPLKENAIVARFTGDATPGAHMHVEAHTLLDVIFDKRVEAKSARGKRVMSSLVAISDFVAHEVMPPLMGCFPDASYGIGERPPE